MISSIKIFKNSAFIQFLFILLLLLMLVACERIQDKAPLKEKVEKVSDSEVNEDIEAIDEMTMTDFDGNHYETVMIGDQLWMAENLRVTHYNDGSKIESVSANGDRANDRAFGLLYDFHAVNKSGKNLSPPGWHIPTQEEWETLVQSLGGQDIAGQLMKDSNYWGDPINSEASLFRARPAGMYDFTNVFQWFNTSACFSSSSMGDGASALYYYINDEGHQILKGNFHPNDAVSVRLIKDKIDEVENLTSAYNQAYQENYEADSLETILLNASHSYVLLDPFSEENIGKYVDEIKAQNNDVSAYISIGTGEKWRKDFDELRPFLVTKQWGQWEGEYFVDTTQTGINDVMKRRIDKIAQMGFDWVEFDNMDWAFDEDSRDEYGFIVTEQEAIKYYNLLSEYAHQKGLKCMAKNLTVNIEGFDGVTFESYSSDMNWWDEDALKTLIKRGKVVLIVHYYETNNDEVYKQYKDIYGDSILFISEDIETRKYRHYE